MTTTVPLATARRRRDEARTRERDEGGARGPSSRSVLYIGLAANAAVMVAKFVAGAITGSMAMVTEGIHSVIDTANEGLLLVGERRAHRKADETHPFGYAKEIYLWSAVVAVGMFAAGGAASVAEGIGRILRPSPIESPIASYVVLAFALVVDAISFAVAFRKLHASRPQQGFFGAVESSKDPRVYTVAMEDAAAIVGNVIALVATFLGHVLHNEYLDGAASIAIGLLLGSVSVVLIRETGALVVGESSSDDLVNDIRDAIAAEDAIDDVSAVRTMHLGPRTVLASATVRFAEGAAARDVADAIRRVRAELGERHEEIRHLYFDVGADDA